MPTLFCDLDGVMADFDGHVFALFGQTPTALGDDRLWALVEQTPNFWLSIPASAGAEALWDAIRDYHPIFLSGCPQTGYERAEEHKRLWVEHHFGAQPVITCRSVNKPRHMRDDGDVLIDDFRRNIERWQQAGGKGILHRDVAATIALVQDAMGAVA